MMPRGTVPAAPADPVNAAGAPHSDVSAAFNTFATNVGVAALSLASVLIVSRALGPSGRGSVALLTTIAVVTQYCFNLGVQEANVNIGSADPQTRPALATNSVVFALLLGSLAVGVLGGAATLVPAIVGHARSELLLLVLVSIPIQLVGGYLFRLVQSDYRFAKSNLAWIAAPLATVSVNATLFAVGSLSVRSALGAWVAGQTLQAVLLIRETGRAFGFGRPNYRLARKTIRFGVRVYPTTFMSFTNYRLDQWLLGTLSTRRELGFYSVAVSWAEALFFLPTAIGYAQRPTLVRARRSLATKQAAAAFRIATGLTLLLVLCMIAAAPILCVLTFGRPFRESILDLRILTVGAFGILSLKLLGNAITAQGDPLKQTADPALRRSRSSGGVGGRLQRRWSRDGRSVHARDERELARLCPGPQGSDRVHGDAEPGLAKSISGRHGGFGDQVGDRNALTAPVTRPLPQTSCMVASTGAVRQPPGETAPAIASAAP
jgi:O-antigen/teichoic acid export membrane protein